MKLKKINKVYFKNILHILLLTPLLNANAQTHDYITGAWLKYSFKLDVKPKKNGFVGDIQRRSNDFEVNLNQFVIRNGYFKNINNSTVSIGYAFLENHKDNISFTENRIHQYFSNKTKLYKHNYLKQRFKLEERFIENTDFFTRFRYGIVYSFNLFEIKKDKPLLVSISNEIFFNNIIKINNLKFDRNRFSLHLGGKISKHANLKIGGMYQITQTKSKIHAMISFGHSLDFSEIHF